MRSYTGFVSRTAISDLLEDKILPHEATLQHKESKTMHRIIDNQLIQKPILMVYRSHPMIKNILEQWMLDHEPWSTFQEKPTGTRHLIWKIGDPAVIDLLVKAASTVRRAYLADGHHRAAAMRKWQSDAHAHQYVFSAYFDFDQVDILAYHRLVKTGLEMVPKFLTRISRYAKRLNTPFLSAPTKYHFLVITADGIQHYKWRKTALKYAHEKLPISIDSYLLNFFVMKKIFGFSDIRSNDDIQYIEGRHSILSLRNTVLEQPGSVGFYLAPINKRDFRTCAKSQIMLPPKSTWFQPRLPTGLVTYSFVANR